MSSTFITAAVLLFVAVVLGCQGVWEWWNSRHSAVARRLQARLEALAAGGEARKETLSILKSRRLSNSSLLDRVLSMTPGIRALDAFIMQAGVRWSVMEFLGMCAGLALAGGAAVWFVHLSPLAVLAVAVTGALSPVVYIRWRRARRLLQFVRQLPEVCDMLVRALRSGHAFSGAIDLVGTQFAEPAGGEFRITFDEINYGASLGDALTGLANRMPVADLRYLVIAVLIQRETGGNLAELLEGIASLVRERFRLFDKVRVLAAEGKLSAWVLGLLPFGSAALIHVTNPTFLATLWTDPAGVMLLQIAAFDMVFGALWIRRIVRIRA
ncbi:type II secretion system F family protein [Paraburkholderia sp. J7]|uniref:type II secretion system F family protein n=1 Tax=Paraburkholderia sp. J7 TaxID=2805438 RepID=UPI002AB6FC13|nr:type II secretion system F family protein [Paraburkholderia sp. J7]